MSAEAPSDLAELRATLTADLARNAAAGPRLTLIIFRVGQYCTFGHGLLPRALTPFWLLVARIYLRTRLGAEIPSCVRCGPGLALPHAGRGVVIHANASIGGNSMIFHRVTLGTHGTDEAPQLDHNVAVGTGACVIGPVVVGAGAKIGANAVVTRDVPAGVSVGGVPAHPVRATADPGLPR